jgi:hypothetical protein
MSNHGLRGRRQCRSRPKVNFVRRLISERRMRPLLVIKPKIRCQMDSSFRDRLVFMKIHFFVLDRSPESLDENVVVNPSPAVHTDPDVVAL